MDPLSHALHNFHLRCFVPGLAQLSAPWGVKFEPPKPEELDAHFARHDIEPPAHMMARRPMVVGGFFAVIRGYCELEVPHADARATLVAGDVAIVCRPSPHILRDQVGSPTRPAYEYASYGPAPHHRPTGLRSGGDGPITQFIHGPFMLEDEGDDSLMRAMPPIAHLRVDDSPADTGLADTVRHMLGEIRSRTLGTDTILSHLAYILFTQSLRTYLAQQNESELKHWFLGIRDPQIGEVLGLMHAQLDKPWSVASLAENAAMSRSAFAKRFVEVVGETPLAHLASCRMQLARRLLRDPVNSIKSISRRCGYGSDPSFSNAFKREHGISAAEYRKRQL